MGLTENPSAFRHWMVAGPEQACLLNEFESQLSGHYDEENVHQSVSVLELFKNHVCVLYSSIINMGNLVLNTCNCANDDIVQEYNWDYLDTKITFKMWLSQSKLQFTNQLRFTKIAYPYLSGKKFNKIK